MTYNIEIHPQCQKEIRALCKKNHALEQALKKKMSEIVENPLHYKPLLYDLAGERRVHILKSFVLKFEVSETVQTVTFIFFGHHDEAYKM
ncbi:type II toxin-antitoxin system RelE/ParE family toxin [Candidatus Woesearchaeota archaeon]|nr:type II toxin-antitoxin system RelE/ParE family toxin [Candidatus Woesearchaeota archaeon]